MSAIAGPYIASLSAAGGDPQIIYSGPAAVLLDKAQIYAMVYLLGIQLGFPPPRFDAGEERPDWKPSRDDATPNPGTGPAAEQDHYDPGARNKGSFGNMLNVLATIIDILYRTGEAALIPQVQKVMADIIKFVRSGVPSAQTVQAEIDSLFAELKKFGI
jgi:hypothetical protein